MSDAKQILVNWANGQSGWIKTLCKEIVDAGAPLAPTSLDELYIQFAIEKHLQGGEITASEDVILLSSGMEVDERIYFNKLSNVERVNRLAPGQEFVFNKALTVIFGENAAGKSGYVRILKAIAAARSHEEILADIDATTTGMPCATIAYTFGNKDDTFTWKGEKGVAPFNRVGIFDSRAMLFHVDDDLTYRVTPFNLSLFKYVHESIELIKRRLEEEIKARKNKTNPFLIHFTKGTSIYSRIEVLGASTDLRDLELLSNVSPEEESEISSLEEQVVSLQSGITSTRIEGLEARINLLKKGTALVEKIERVDWTYFNNLLSEHSSTQAQLRQVTEGEFAGINIPGFLSDSWINFIKAGDLYLKNNPLSTTSCIYCLQPLEGTAEELLAKYKLFCNDDLSRKLQKQEIALATFIREVNFPGIDDYRTNVQRKLENPQSQNKDLLQAKLELTELYISVTKDVNSYKHIDVTRLIGIASSLKSTSVPLIESASSSIVDLKKQGTERQLALNAASNKLKNIQARITLRSLFPQITPFVNEAKWVSQAEIIYGGFGQILRSLTGQSKFASEDLLNKNFEELFEQERSALNAPQVKLNFPGQKGEAARRKVLSSRHKLSDILSEGEQKVIALADFLAETAIRKNSCPIIFDDPVNSLDYKRMNHIVNRIYQLVPNQQVIVFTHNIWFATSLLARYESHREFCTYYDVTQTGKMSGYIHSGTHPRWDTASVIRGRINKLLQDARTLSGESQQALIETCYDTLRGWCEVVVEQELFSKVSQRYSPHVAMTQLIKIHYSKLPAAVNVILPIFEKCCRIMPGHSQPLETLNVRPTLQELELDWNAAQAALAEYQKI